jgi:hypothetical protein
MQTAIRLKQKVTSEKIVISIPEIAKLNGREIEIIILVDGELENTSIPPKAIQNSGHVAGSIVLDEEAMQELMRSRFL